MYCYFLKTEPPSFGLCSKFPLFGTLSDFMYISVSQFTEVICFSGMFIENL